MITQEVLSQLSDSEMSVYRYASCHLDSIGGMSIRDFASTVHISPTSALRFCRKLGFDGWNSFRAYARSTADEERGRELHGDVYEVVDCLKRMMNAEFDAQLDEVAMRMVESHSVLFVGSGMSGVVAQYGARFLSCVGCLSFYINDPLFPATTGALEDDLVVALSVSGESRDTIGHIASLQQRGCSVVSITSSVNCTLSRLADYQLAYYISVATYADVYNLTTQIPSMSIIERLGKKVHALISSAS